MLKKKTKKKLKLLDNHIFKLFKALGRMGERRRKEINKEKRSGGMRKGEGKKGEREGVRK